MVRVREMRFAAPLILAAIAGACELTEVITVEPEEILVVEAILRAGDPTQRIILHRSVREGRVPGERGATVVVRPEDGRALHYLETPMAECVDLEGDDEASPTSGIAPSCYLSERVVPRPGVPYTLEVTTASGERLEGETVIPGAIRWRAPALPFGMNRCILPPGQSLTLAWTPAEGAWAYIGEMEIEGLQEALAARGIDVELPSPLRLTGLSVSEGDTTMTLPRDFGLFQRASLPLEALQALQNGLPEGTSARLVLAAADRNYVNAVRGGAFNPSGTVRVASVRGDGTGVFASIVPLSLEIITEGNAVSCLR